MKRTYAFILSGAMLVNFGLVSCSGENTTGVDIENSEEAYDGEVNEGSLDRDVEEDELRNNQGTDLRDRGIEQDTPVMLDPDVGPVDPIGEENPGGPIRETEEEEF
ncbi:hypothetical protein CLV24_12839 [Pontibacter ummariensis]|uniref:Uncharacterized protein n=1 Tax=Pontibacter ummariensis TaxID=1610492 RepID=A0A239K8F3_9BACT|nr:hypothetical protein [Pontibacter ummariensis]PRY06057.1 hypothetical protein CLV24_12839 [Pontibacter ummariensis]SNT14657.1 hypothetical protein SAMN06296052_12739 [Pontibacter ummariensis]